MTSPQPAATVDLQVHSTASDGAVAPADIAAIAVSARLSAFALTDHDSMAGVADATAAAARVGVRVIPGVELSAMHGDREVHLLGLHIESRSTIETRLIEFRAQREDRAAAIVRKLQALGASVSYDDVVREAAGAAIGRPHVARVLVKAGGAADFRDAFDRFLGAGRPAFVPKPRLLARDAIALIHDAGAIAVWAHPGPLGRREMIEALVADGLDGIEILHPGHSAEDTARLRALCDHVQILPSGGSDWHGEMTGARTLGVMAVPAEWLARQDERVAARRGAGVT
ncbi:MAG TPA: PHP domain-containing protein [Gemmatimonadaceae bacterium]|nr:PHP domain-containing protein [Gemmatimonadaceae bacterium]